MTKITYMGLFGMVTIDTRKLNPLIKTFGKGPDDKKCKHCKHFFEKHYSKKYFKCELRGDTNGPGTDHRANWPACGKFKESDNG